MSTETIRLIRDAKWLTQCSVLFIVQVKNGDNLAIPNTFLVHSKQKAIELLEE